MLNNVYYLTKELKSLMPVKESVKTWEMKIGMALIFFIILCLSSFSNSTQWKEIIIKGIENNVLKNVLHGNQTDFDNLTF